MDKEFEEILKRCTKRSKIELDLHEEYFNKFGEYPSFDVDDSDKVQIEKLTNAIRDNKMIVIHDEGILDFDEALYNNILFRIFLVIFRIFIVIATPFFAIIRLFLWIFDE